jgi:hypothetical protein
MKRHSQAYLNGFEQMQKKSCALAVKNDTFSEAESLSCLFT